MKTVIEMAHEAGFSLYRDISAADGSFANLERFAELVRAEDRKSRVHSLGPGEMELSLRREHSGELFECRRRFSAEEVILGPDWIVEATAKRLDFEMDRAIQARSNT